MMMNRRDLLATSLVGAAVASGPAQAAGASPGGRAASALPAPMREPFVNFERAYALMEANGVDAIVCRLPTNTYYLTSFRPFWWQDNFHGYPIAIMTRRPQDHIALVTAAQAYYYMVADGHPTYPYAYYLFTAPDPGSRREGATQPGALTAPNAIGAHGFRNLGLEPLTPVEAGRARALETALAKIPPSADEAWALRKAFRDLGLEKARVAVDDDQLVGEISQLAPEARVVRGDNLMFRIRQVKTPQVIALQKLAAQANAEAARAAVLTTARPGATYHDLRGAFVREVGQRGGNPVGMVINMVSSPLFDAEFKRGDVFFIDNVSEYQMCHGDFGRTICLGEPRRSMKRATEAAQLGWTSIRERLRPGLRFSEIRAIGREALRRDGYDFDIGFTPHNVGLTHTEEPNRPDLPFHLADTVLEPGMVLSVDCPVIDTGMGGTAHLEDLVVITADGHQAINDLAHPVIVV